MPSQTDHMTLYDYVRTLRAHRLVLAVVTVLGAAVALGFALQARPTYTAQASLALRDPSQDYGAVGSAVVQAETPQQLASAGAETTTTADVTKRVKQQLHSGQSVTQLEHSVTASVDQASNFVIVAANAPTAAGAAALANAFAYQSTAISNRNARARFSAEAKALSGKIAAVGKSPRNTDAVLELQTERARFLALGNFAQPAQVVQPATPPSSPSSPTPAFDAVLGGVVGFIIALLIVFGRIAVDRRVRDVQDIERLLEIPFIGDLRADALGRTPVGDNDREPLSPADLESVRIIRRNLDFVTGQDRVRTVVVTSALPQEGKSTLAAALAFSAATIGRRTLLLECDLRRPILAARFGLRAGPGLADYLNREATPKEILQVISTAPAQNGSQPVTAGQLVCIVAGTPTDRTDELLSSVGFQELLGEIGSAYDLVVIDSAPVLPVADTLEIVPLVDGVVLCVRARQTTRDQALAAKAAITRLPTRPLVLVVTAVSPMDGYGSYAYSYAYSAHSDDADARV